MAVRSANKISQVRRPVRGRELQVQRLNDKEIQAVETFVAVLCEKVDLNRNPSAEWARGFVWADLYSGLGKIFGEVHHSLSQSVFSEVWLQRVRLETEPREFPKGDRARITVGPPIKRRRLLENAGTRVPYDVRVDAGKSKEDIRRGRK